jgi:hypothetical protein
MQIYKVVERKTRHCSNWAIFKSHDNWKEGCWFRKKHIQYFPRYLKGRVVEAVKGSAGLLTFEYLKDAKFFIKRNLMADLIIIKVEGIGDKRRVNRLKGNCGGDPSSIFREDEEMIAPEGTLAFNSVKVLE